jgi:hypothetical protein
MGFKEMKMMKSTEPSVDEVGKGMKKGGKLKMQMGGAMPVAPLAAAAAPMGRRPMPARPAMGRPAMGRRPDPRAAMVEAAMAQRAPMMRKKGGEVESKEMHAKEERQIKGIKKELMTHEGKPASKAHKGLATGGVANAQGGYKKGGVAKYATGGLIQKYATGGVVNGAAGYKDGGHCGMKSGGEAGFKANKKSCSW